MLFQEYFDQVGEAIEFLIAICAIIGMFMIIIAILWGVIAGKRQIKSTIILMIVGIL